MNGMMTGVLLDGMKVKSKLTTFPQAHFSPGSFDLSAMSSPKWFEWVEMNLDTFPLNFGPDGAGGRKILSNSQRRVYF